MEELFNSIKAYLYDRTSSPLFGTFLVSLVAWNYKFVLVIFSSMPVIEKFDYISSTLYSYSPFWVLSNPLLFLIAYPAATTLAYVKLYPIPAKWFYEKTRTTQKELLEVKQKIEDLTPIPQEEANEIRRDLAKIRIEHGKELKIKDDQIELLNATIAEKDQQLDIEMNGAEALSEREVSQEMASANETELEKIVNDKETEIMGLALTQEDIERERYEFERKLKDMEQELVERDKQNQLLAEQIKNTGEHDEEPHEGLTKNHSQLLYLLSTRENFNEEFIMNASDRSQGETLADLGFLLSKELILKNNLDGKPSYAISPRGKALIARDPVNYSV